MLLGDLLRQVRQSQQLSQLALAEKLGISQRHVSFIEQERSRPSRALLLRWLRELGSDQSVINAAMVQAGYLAEPLERTQSDGDDEIKCICRILHTCDPFPAFAFDADWRMIEINASGQWLCSLLMPTVWMQVREPRAGLDMIAALEHPNGLFSKMVEPAGVARALLRQLRTEQIMNPRLRPRADRLEQKLRGIYPMEEDAPIRKHNSTQLELAFRTCFGRLEFVTQQLLVSLPQNVDSASIRMEMWFPASNATRCILHAHSYTTSTSVDECYGTDRYQSNDLASTCEPTQCSSTFLSL